MKKFWKWLLILFVIIGLPVVIIVTVLYWDNQYLLHKFETWLNEPGNLTAFVAAVALYLPLINGIWKTGLLISQSTRDSQLRKKEKSKSWTKIYDDGKDNSIYWDSSNDIINLSIKSPEKVNLYDLTNMVTAEMRVRVLNYEKQKKDKN